MQERGQAPVVNPREFLKIPPSNVEVGTLPSAPDIEMLKYLPFARNAAGLVLYNDVWYVIRGNMMGVPVYAMPKDSNIRLHSRGEEREQKEFEPLPTVGDFMNSSSVARNLMVSPVGITQYWRVTDKEALRTLSFSRGRSFDTREEYDEFLQEVGARYEVHPWEEVDDALLARLLDPQLQ